MSVYVIHLVIASVLLIFACVGLFAVFRHIAIRRSEYWNPKNDNLSSGAKVENHKSNDNLIAFLCVVVIVALLVVLMEEGKGMRWAMMGISYVVVSFVAVSFLIKSGKIVPSVLERKWEYWSIFSLLVFLAGAGIALIRYSILMMKYGDLYIGAARIIGYNEEDDAQEAVAQYDEVQDQEEGEGEHEDEDERQGEGEHEDEREENGEEGENEPEEEGENEHEEEGENEHEEEGENEPEEEGENEPEEEGEGENEHEDEAEERGEGDRRKLEDNGDGNEDFGNDEESEEEYETIKVAWGGSWGCPLSPETYCTANIETPCSQWDVDNLYGTNTPADWKYWDGEVDGRLDEKFSCSTGFADGIEGSGYSANLSPLEGNDAYPYAYIVGDCTSCTANWAWTPLHHRSQEMTGFGTLFLGYLLLATIAILMYAIFTVTRQCKKHSESKSNAVLLLENEGGVSA